MNGPEEIWIDKRVVRTMKTEPDEEAADRGVVQIRYISAERVDEIMQSHHGAEFFIQIEVGDGQYGDQTMYGLTNYGRLYRQKITGGVYPWEEIDVPDFK